LAGGMALYGSIHAANIQAQAGRKLMQDNFDFTRQRDAALRSEEVRNISNAIRGEIIVLSEVLISNLRILDAIRNGTIPVMRKNMRTVIMNPEPTIYKAVAGRVGILPYPVVQFYMRLAEIEDSLQIIVVGLDDENGLVPGKEVEKLAKPVVIACRLARAIIDQETASTVDDKDIARVTLAHIDVALEGAKRSFATAFDR
jgi:hypothetical protein